MSILTTPEIRRSLNDGAPGPALFNMGDIIQIGELGKRKKKKKGGWKKKLKKFHSFTSPVGIHKRHIAMLKKLKKKKGKKKKKRSKRGSGDGGGEEAAMEMPDETAATAEATAEEIPQVPTMGLTIPAAPSAYYDGAPGPAMPSGASAYYQPPAGGYPPPSYPQPQPSYYPPSPYQMSQMQQDEGGGEEYEQGEEAQQGTSSPRPSMPGPEMEEILDPNEEEGSEISGMGLDFSAPYRWTAQAASAAARASQAPALTKSTFAADFTPIITAAGQALSQGLTTYQANKSAMAEAKRSGGPLPQAMPPGYFNVPSTQPAAGIPSWALWALGGVAALIFLPRIMGK
jgi:hypothetical protein